MWFPPAAMREMERVLGSGWKRAGLGTETSSWWEIPSWPEPLEPRVNRAIITNVVFVLLEHLELVRGELKCGPWNDIHKCVYRGAMQVSDELHNPSFTRVCLKPSKPRDFTKIYRPPRVILFPRPSSPAQLHHAVTPTRAHTRPMV